MSDPRVRLLFEPSSVAIIGASSDPAKASGLPLRNIAKSKFTGKIYPVNPRAAEISGLTCYPTVSDLPEAPDVAVLMVDARLSPEVLEECGKKGVKTAIIGSAGFSESGPEGRERQERLSRSRESLQHSGRRAELPRHIQRAQKYSLRLRSRLRAAAQARAGRHRIAQRRVARCAGPSRRPGRPRAQLSRQQR